MVVLPESVFGAHLQLLSCTADQKVLAAERCRHASMHIIRDIMFSANDWHRAQHETLAALQPAAMQHCCLKLLSEHRMQQDFVHP